MQKTFSHHHLLDIGPLSCADIESLFQKAEHYLIQNRSLNKKSTKLAGKTIVNLFYEPSTRTRTSFEIAAKRLGADLVNITIENSSAKKGETLLDTSLNLDAMGIDAFVVRHYETRAPHTIAEHVKASVVNAGDGVNEHPTQALLDAFTMIHHKNKLAGLKVAICGDIAHSRVARSNVCLLQKFGVEVHIVAPAIFMLQDFGGVPVHFFENIREGIKDVDVIIMLRIQHERIAAGELAMSLAEYHQLCGLDHEKIRLAKPDVIVMHPGPINRGVEITSALADDPKFSVIREQVESGVAMRMAVLDSLLSDT